MQYGLRGVPAFVIGDNHFAGLDTQRILNSIDYNVIQCPQCSQRLRLPKNKGTVRIKCQQCHNSFEYRT